MIVWDLLVAAIAYGILVTIKWRRAERRTIHRRLWR